MSRIQSLQRVVSLLVLLLALSLGSASAREINLNQLDALVGTCLKLIKNGDYRGAALMYHYPPDYTEAELQADLEGVEGSLKIFAEEFGHFRDAGPLDEPKLYLNIFASGGTHKYWEEHPDALKIELQTEFENFGPGYIIIQLVDIVGILEVKAVAFGLPVSGESVKKIKQVGDRMLLLMQQHQAKSGAL